MLLMIFASGEKHKGMEPTHDKQFKACTDGSEDGGKYKSLEIYFPYIDEHDVEDLADIGEEEWIHGEKYFEEHPNLQQALYYLV